MSIYKSILDSFYPKIENNVNKFILDFKKEKIYEGLAKNKISLENLILNSENLLEIVFDKFPLKIDNAVIGKINISLPDFKNIMKESVVVEIEDVLIETSQTKEWMENYQRCFYKIKLNFLEKLKKSVIEELDKENESSMAGIINNAVSNIIENLKINILNFKFIFKFGLNSQLLVVYEEINYYPTNNIYEYQVIEKSKNTSDYTYKIFNLKNFSVSKINNSSVQKIDENDEIKEKYNSSKNYYILNPFNLTTKIKIYQKSLKEKFKFEFDMNLNNFNFNLDKECFNSIILLGNEICLFYNKLKEIILTKQLQKHKSCLIPIAGIDCINGINGVSNKDSKIFLFRYAIKTVINLNKLFKSKNDNQCDSIFQISDFKINRCRNLFNSIFSTSNSNPICFNSSNLDAEKISEIKKIMNLVEEEDLCLFTQPLIEKEYLEIKKKNNQPKGFMSFFGGNKNQPPVEIKITEEDSRKIKKLIIDLYENEKGGDKHGNQSNQTDFLSSYSLFKNFSFDLKIDAINFNLKSRINTLNVYAGGLQISSSRRENIFSMKNEIRKISLNFLDAENLRVETEKNINIDHKPSTAELEKPIVKCELEYNTSIKDKLPILKCQFESQPFSWKFDYNSIFFVFDFIRIPKSINQDSRIHMINFIKQNLVDYKIRSKNDILYFYKFNLEIEILINSFQIEIPIEKNKFDLNLEKDMLYPLDKYIFGISKLEIKNFPQPLNSMQILSNDLNLQIENLHLKSLSSQLYLITPFNVRSDILFSKRKDKLNDKEKDEFSHIDVDKDEDRDLCQDFIFDVDSLKFNFDPKILSNLNYLSNVFLQHKNLFFNIKNIENIENIENIGNKEINESINLFCIDNTNLLENSLHFDNVLFYDKFFEKWTEKIICISDDVIYLFDQDRETSSDNTQISQKFFSLKNTEINFENFSEKMFILKNNLEEIKIKCLSENKYVMWTFKLNFSKLRNHGSIQTFSNHLENSKISGLKLNSKVSYDVTLRNFSKSFCINEGSDLLKLNVEKIIFNNHTENTLSSSTLILQFENFSVFSSQNQNKSKQDTFILMNKLNFDIKFIFDIKEKSSTLKLNLGALIFNFRQYDLSLIKSVVYICSRLKHNKYIHENDTYGTLPEKKQKILKNSNFKIFNILNSILPSSCEKTDLQITIPDIKINLYGGLENFLTFQLTKMKIEYSYLLGEFANFQNLLFSLNQVNLVYFDFNFDKKNNFESQEDILCVSQIDLKFFIENELNLMKSSAIIKNIKSIFRYDFFYLLSQFINNCYMLPVFEDEITEEHFEKIENSENLISAMAQIDLDLIIENNDFIFKTEKEDPFLNCEFIGISLPLINLNISYKNYQKQIMLLEEVKFDIIENAKNAKNQSFLNSRIENYIDNSYSHSQSQLSNTSILNNQIDYLNVNSILSKLEVFIFDYSNSSISKRYLINTVEDNPANYYFVDLKLQFFVYLNSSNEIISSSSSIVNFNKFSLKLSYKDINTFRKAVLLNYYLTNLKSEIFSNKEKNVKIKKNVNIKKNEENFNFVQKIEKKDEFIIQKNFRQKNNFFDLFSIEINLSNFELTLIDDNLNVYYPFLSAKIKNVMSILKLNFNSKDKLKLDISLFLESSSYNNICGIWEPLIEPVPMFLYYVKEVTKKSENFYVEKDSVIFNISDTKHGSFNLNISDMNISSLCVSLSSWIEKFKNEITRQIEFENSIYNSSFESTTKGNTKIGKISNHQICNLSGRNLNLKIGSFTNCTNFNHYEVDINNHEDRSKSKEDFIYLLKTDEIYDLEYSFSKNIKIQFFIENIENSENIKNSEKIIDIDKIQVKYHQITFPDEAVYKIPLPYDYLVSEVICENQKKIITIYSPLIFYNKTDSIFLLTLTQTDGDNSNKSDNSNNSIILILNPHSKIAIPNEYLTCWLELQNSSYYSSDQKISLMEILNTPMSKNYFKMIKINTSFYNLFRNVEGKTNYNSHNVREIKITTSYAIRNCLPLDICLFNPFNKNSLIVKKSERYMIDNLNLSDSLFCNFSFSHYRTQGGVNLYNSKNGNENEKEKVNLIKLEDTCLKNFYPSISFFLNKDKLLREVVLFSSHIIINESGLKDLNLFYDTKTEMISSDNQNKENKIFLYDNNLSQNNHLFLDIHSAQSSYVKIDDIIQESNLMVYCKGKNKYYEFILQSSLSNLPNVEEIYSNIIKISPSVIVHNNLDLYEICISLKEDPYTYDIVKTDDSNQGSLPFYFFGNWNGKNSEVLIRPAVHDEYMNEIGVKFNWSHPVSFTHVGLMTIPVYSELYASHGDSVINFEKSERSEKMKMYLNIEIKIENLITHVYICKADKSNSQLVIENNLGINSNQFDEEYPLGIVVYQEGYEKYNRDYIMKDQFIIYSLINYYSNINHNRLDENIICFNVPVKNSSEISKSNYSNIKFCVYEDGVKCLTNKIDTNKNEYPYKLEFAKNIKVEFLSNGLKKTIKFSYIHEENSKNLKNSKNSENLLFEKINIFSSNNFIPQSVNTDQNLNVFTQHILNIELYADSLGISVISDNKFKDKKLRNYKRSEIIYILLSNIMFSYKKENSNSLETEDSELSLVIQDLVVENQVSLFAKFPRVIHTLNDEDNSNRLIPFFRLSVFSQIHLQDKISRIKYLNYNIKKIKIGVDVEFVENIIHFVNNIFYLMKTDFIGVFEIFKNFENSVKNENLKKIQEKNSNYKFFSNILGASSIDLVISLSDKGFKQFLQKHLKIGSFLISLINNLTVLEDIKINLAGNAFKYYYGDVNDIIFKLLNYYKQKLCSKILGLGTHSVLLGIYKIFHPSQDANLPMIPFKFRVRHPRAFYGRFKSILPFSILHSEILDLVRRRKIKFFDSDSNSNSDNEEMQMQMQMQINLDFYNCERIQMNQTTEIIILFTTKSLILINTLTWSPFCIIDYFMISKLKIEEKCIVVEFNQLVDGMKEFFIPFIDICKAERLIKEISKAMEDNADEIYNFN